MASSTDQMSIQSLRRRKTMSIASGAAISDILDLAGYWIAAIDWASGTTVNTPMTFQGSQDATTFYNLYDDAGTEVTIASGAFATADARAIIPGFSLSAQLLTHRWLKFRRGPATAPASTTQAVSFDVVLGNL
mgnify:CR=1 FL=1